MLLLAYLHTIADGFNTGIGREPLNCNVCLGEVSELDETFVLDCYKGKQLSDDISRMPRKHGAKAEKRGNSLFSEIF